VTRLVPWIFAAIAGASVGCSLIVDSAPFVRPSCRYTFGAEGMGEVTGSCRQFLCRPAGYEEWSMTTYAGVEDAGAGFVLLSAHVQSIPPDFFHMGSYDETLLQSGVVEASVGARRWMARIPASGGDPTHESLGLSLSEVIGGDVCNGFFRGRLNASMVEVDPLTGTTLPTISAAYLQMVLGE
jgi:hypothetical protein